MERKNESNSFLRKVTSERKRHYYFDIQSGKHYLINEDGSQIQITKAGTFPPKFRKNLTGLKTHKQRKLQSTKAEGVLHFVPETTFKIQNCFYTPQPQKYVGYAQSPYLLKGRSTPQHLDRPKTCQLKMNEELRKSSSLYVSEKSGRKERKTYNKIAKAKTQTIKSEQSTLVSTLKETSGHYFETSYNSMTNAHPLPKFPKKTCYNYKCKNLKNFTFNSEKQKLEIKRKTDTFGKSFFEAQINIEKKQAKLHEKIR